MEITEQALLFAIKAHEGQVRKYTGEPYINHCIEVAATVRKFCKGSLENAIAAAYLHDVVEDTDMDMTDISQRFNPEVYYHVNALTNISNERDGNRKKRKQIDLEHLVAHGNIDTYFIKCADILSNTNDIVDNSPKFAETYLIECRRILEAIYSPMREATGWYSIIHGDADSQIDRKFSQLDSEVLK